MRELIVEILLRLAKAVAAALVAAFVLLVAVTVGGATPTIELVLLAWLSGAAFILLVQESPI